MSYDLTLTVVGLISASARLTTDLRERFTPFGSHIIVSDREILKCIG
jgi:hypothetical protein